MKVNTALTELSLPPEEKEVSSVTKAALAVADTLLEPTRYLINGKKVTSKVINDRTERIGAVAGIVFKEKEKVPSSGVGGTIKKIGLKALSIIFFIPTGLVGGLIKAGVFCFSSATRDRYRNLENKLLLGGGLGRDIQKAGLLISGKSSEDILALTHLFQEKQEQGNLNNFLEQLCAQDWFGIESFDFVQRCLPEDFEEGAFIMLKTDALNLKLSSVIEQVKEYIQDSDEHNFRAHIENIPLQDRVTFLHLLYGQPWFTAESSLFVDKACASLEGYEDAKETALKMARVDIEMNQILAEMKGLLKNNSIEKIQENVKRIPQEHLVPFLETLSIQDWMTFGKWEVLLSLCPQELVLPKELQVPPVLFRSSGRRVEGWIRKGLDKKDPDPTASSSLRDFLGAMSARERAIFIRHMRGEDFLQNEKNLSFFNSSLPPEDEI
jgi:hypothetical protein